MTTRELLLKPEATATALLVAVSDRCGPDLLQWDPETVAMEISDTFGVDIAPRNFGKLMAAIEVVTTDHFTTNVSDYVRLCNALLHGNMDPAVFDPADVGEITLGTAEAMILWPTDEPLPQEILGYIAAMLAEEGFVSTPDVLRGLGVPALESLKRAQADYADDPTMFASIYQLAQSRETELMDDLREHLGKILTQLRDLQLVNGKVPEDILSKATKILPSSEDSNG
jgi:hypothetical protein